MHDLITVRKQIFHALMYSSGLLLREDCQIDSHFLLYNVGFCLAAYLQLLPHDLVCID